MICGQLEQRGVVTPADLKAAQADDSTPGRRLLQAIRLWGESLQERGRISAGKISSNARHCTNKRNDMRQPKDPDNGQTSIIRTMTRRLRKKLQAQGCGPAHIRRVIAYERRVLQLEAEGCTRSDAQAVADCEAVGKALATSDHSK